MSKISQEYKIGNPENVNSSTLEPNNLDQTSRQQPQFERMFVLRNGHSRYWRGLHFDVDQCIVQGDRVDDGRWDDSFDRDLLLRVWLVD